MTDAVYVDSSALVKLVKEEVHSPALQRTLATHDLVVSSRLTEVEVHRAARVANLSADHTARADDALAGCDLAPVGDAVIAKARELASVRLRTLDAVHLATALMLRARWMVTYDRRLAEAARELGLEVLSPA